MLQYLLILNYLSQNISLFFQLVPCLFGILDTQACELWVASPKLAAPQLVNSLHKGTTISGAS